MQLETFQVFRFGVPRKRSKHGIRTHFVLSPTSLIGCYCAQDLRSYRQKPPGTLAKGTAQLVKHVKIPISLLVP